MIDQQYVYDTKEKLAYKVNRQGEIIGQYSCEESKKLEEFLCRGILVTINGNKYWFFRDAEEQLWILGDVIEPVKVTPEVTSTIEGEMWKQRRLTVYEGDKVCFTADYVSVQREVGIEMYFEEWDDDGLFIHNVLHQSERRLYAWSAAWRDKSLRKKG